MFDSHRSLLARHIGPLLVFVCVCKNGKMSVLEYFLFFFFPKQLHAALMEHSAWFL